MKKINYIWVLLSILCVVLGACDSHDKNESTNNFNTSSLTAEDIVGEWYYDYREGGIFWEFYADGEFEREDEYDTKNGRYSLYCGDGGAWGVYYIENNQLVTVNYPEYDDDNCGKQTYSISLRKNKLYIDGIEYYRYYDNNDW